MTFEELKKSFDTFKPLITTEMMECAYSHREECTVFFREELKKFLTREGEYRAIKPRPEKTPHYNAGIQRDAAGSSGTGSSQSYAAFYGFFFLPEFDDKESFELVCDVFSMEEETLDYFGDAVTENFPHILYKLYNGNMDRLMELIKREDVCSWCRTAGIMVYTTLNRDGIVRGEELDSLCEWIVENSEDVIVTTHAAGAIAKLHRIDRIDIIRKAFDRGVIDKSFYGDYKDFIDIIFGHRINNTNLCRDYEIRRELGYWAGFEDGEKLSAAKRFDNIIEDRMQDILYEAFNRINLKPNPVSVQKIGRNDPCPCGSGKKYKKCCMGKENVLPMQEEALRPDVLRMAKGEYYPDMSYDVATGRERPLDRKGGGVYMEDIFSKEEIELDYWMYLADTNLAPAMNNYTRRVILDAKLFYCKKALELLKMRTDKSDYAIHFRVDEWLRKMQHLFEDLIASEEFEALMNHNPG